MAQLDLSGNFIGNKGSFLIFNFRKYLGKYAYPGQKVALATGGNKRRKGGGAFVLPSSSAHLARLASLQGVLLAPCGPAGIAVQARAGMMVPQQSVQQQR